MEGWVLDGLKESQCHDRQVLNGAKTRIFG